MVKLNLISLLFFLLAFGCADRNQSHYFWIDSELIIFGVEGDLVKVSENAGLKFIDELKSREIENSKDLWFMLDTELSCWQTTSIPTDSLLNMENFKLQDLVSESGEPGILFNQKECGFYVNVGNSRDKMNRYLKYLEAEEKAASRIDSLNAYEVYMLNNWPLDYYVIFNAKKDSVLLISEQL